MSSVITNTWKEPNPTGISNVVFLYIQLCPCSPESALMYIGTAYTPKEIIFHQHAHHVLMDRLVRMQSSNGKGLYVHLSDKPLSSQTDEFVKLGKKFKEELKRLYPGYELRIDHDDTGDLGMVAPSVVQMLAGRILAV